MKGPVVSVTVAVVGSQHMFMLCFTNSTYIIMFTLYCYIPSVFIKKANWSLSFFANYMNLMFSSSLMDIVDSSLSSKLFWFSSILYALFSGDSIVYLLSNNLKNEKCFKKFCFSKIFKNGILLNILFHCYLHDLPPGLFRHNYDSPRMLCSLSYCLLSAAELQDEMKLYQRVSEMLYYVHNVVCHVSWLVFEMNQICISISCNCYGMLLTQVKIVNIFDAGYFPKNFVQTAQFYLSFLIYVKSWS